MAKRLYRLPEQGKIAGVAAGFADYFDMDVTLMRLLFVAAVLLSGGTVIIVYIIFAFVMPTEGAAKNEPFDVSEKVDTLANEMKRNGHAENIGNYAGLALILLGAWLLLGQFFPAVFSLQWSIIWPCLVILLGLWIITKGRK
jgi:phage shock protein PspC (stress-responsive transcriptional regulator)